MAITHQPTGLTTTRSNLTFTFSWKITDKDYEAGQQLQYRTNLTEKWTSIEIGCWTTKKTLTLSAANYYPADNDRLNAVWFRVRGKRRPYTETHGKEEKSYTPDWSAWSDKVYVIDNPDRPSLESELLSANRTEFTWKTTNRERSNKPFQDVQYQSIRVKESTVRDGSTLKWSSSNAGWMTGTGTANDSISIKEDSTLLLNTSWTRWVRVRSRGASGPSEWRYDKHVYAMPHKAVISSAKASVSSGTTIVTVKWTAPSSAAHPIDSTTVEYLIATPAADQAVPTGASWTDGNVSDDTSGKDAAKITIPTVLGEDECLWVRVVTRHDSNERYSSAVLVQSGILEEPSGLSVSASIETYRATVTCTNNSSVPDSRLAVVFQKKGWDKGIVLGLIPHGETSVTVQCPSWTNNSDISFSVYAFQGTATRILKNSVYRYAITANMQSKTLKDGGDVPSAPDEVTATVAKRPGEVILRWDWSWKEADCAEISWSQNPHAWESTEQPSTYMITNVNAAKWRVSGLETGVKWYFRVRLAIATDDGYTYGPYSSVSATLGAYESEAVEVDLSSPPATPVLLLSAEVAARKSTVTASWAYVSTDDTHQLYAEVCQATISGSTITYGKPFAHANSEQHVDFQLTGSKWQTGQTYNLCVRVTSGSGHVSEWSEPISLTVADPIICSIDSTSLVETSIVQDYHPEVTVVADSGEYPVNAEDYAQAWDYVPGTHDFVFHYGTWYLNDDPTDPEEYSANWLPAPDRNHIELSVTLTTDPEYLTETVLQSMPLNVTVSGAGEGGTITLVVERAAEYHMVRPDDSTSDGHESETIAIVTRNGDGLLRVKGSQLIGLLDDGASYRLIATIEDKLGQQDSAEIEFEVHWSHQAIIPEGEEELEGLITKIVPIAPTGTGQTDTCDIYRLSADKPELIIKGGSFGTTYVDPYPAIGEGKGHRIVFKTLNGDYITADEQPAWTDLIDEAVLDEYSIIVDFDGRQLILPYNITLSSSWAKDFQLTTYLDGSQQGDWNQGVTRTATYNVVLTEDEDADTIEGMRYLADYHGICHIRTPEGSSYACDIQVSEGNAFNDGIVVSYTLTVTRVDPEGLDGMTYEEWLNELE